MYGHHEERQGMLTSTAGFHPDRRMFFSGQNAPRDAGLVLSTDAKPRLKWTQDLHDRFIQAVNYLGGADKATPKTIMKLMGIPGLTLYHLKSHLQKYRLSKNHHSQANSGPSRNASAGKQPEPTGTQMGNPISAPANKTLHISEALQIQIEVQKRLHEQLEVQKHLQLRIEAQGKYLQSVLEKAQETMGKRSLGPAGLDAAEAQLTELVSDMSNGCLDPQLRRFQSLQAERHQVTDCSIDSCLTSNEVSQRDGEDQRVRMRLGIYGGDVPTCANHEGLNELNLIQSSWADTLRQCKNLSSSVGRDADDFSIRITVERGEGDGCGATAYKVRGEDREGRKLYHEQKMPGLEQDTEMNSRSFGRNSSVELDLNTQEDNPEAPNFKLFDLNGFSWT